MAFGKETQPLLKIIFLLYYILSLPLHHNHDFSPYFPLAEMCQYFFECTIYGFFVDFGQFP